jgi:hypothetical protein
VDDQIATTIDLAPTILELAGIENHYGFYGESLNKLANHQATRQKLMYEFGVNGSHAVLRGIRTLTGKYIFSYCETETEEFYDLVNDPDETVNKIFDPAFADTIAQYRIWLDELRLQYGDTTGQPLSPCSLVNNVSSRQSTTDGLTELQESPVYLWPSPNDGNFSVTGLTGEEETVTARIAIYDPSGRKIMDRILPVSGAFTEEFTLHPGSAEGLYEMKLTMAAKTYSRRFILSR